MGMASRGGSGLQGSQAVESSQRAHREEGGLRGDGDTWRGEPLRRRCPSSLGEGPGSRAPVGRGLSDRSQKELVLEGGSSWWWQLLEALSAFPFFPG